MKELRQIKLALIDNDFMTNRIKSILSVLDETLGGLNKYNSNKYKIFNFYGVSKEDLRFWQEKIMTRQWNCTYVHSKVYDIFLNVLNLSTDDTNTLIRWYIERVYKIKTSYTVIPIHIDVKKYEI